MILVLNCYTLWAVIILIKTVLDRIINGTVNLIIMLVYAYEIKINIHGFECIRQW